MRKLLWQRSRTTRCTCRGAGILWEEPWRFISASLGENEVGRRGRRGKVMKQSLASLPSKYSQVFPPPTVRWRDEGITRRRSKVVSKRENGGSAEASAPGERKGWCDFYPPGWINTNVVRWNGGINNFSKKRLKKYNAYGDTDMLSNVSPLQGLVFFSFVFELR